MSRGPGRIERIVERVLQDADRSFTVEELASLAYPHALEIEKKHRVAVLRALNTVRKRMLFVSARTYCPPWRLILASGTSVRSYAHARVRHCWWSANRSLQDTEDILSEPAIQSVMEPGGLWWIDVEILKARQVNDAEQLRALYSYRSHLARDLDLAALLGRFEPPGTEGFDFAMWAMRARP
jgi:hypothetical protein